MFKQAVASAAALAALAGAQASPLELILEEPGAQVIDFEPVPSLRGSPYSFGVLLGEAGAVVTYTWLGADTAFTNLFQAAGSVLGESRLPGADPQGQSITETVDDTRLLNFSFTTVSPAGQPDAVNGRPGTAFAVFGDGQAPVQTEYGSFQYVLGFNDGGGDLDYDDAVIGISAVPEPGNSAMMLAGLGAGAFMLRRRQRR